MKLKLRTLSLLVAALALLLMPAAALAVPVMPMQFEGDVTIGGNLAPEGTIISAEVADIEVATNAPDGISQEGYYELDVSASEGDVVVLYVDGDKGSEATYPDPMSTWHVVCDLAIEGEAVTYYTLTVDVSPSAGGTVSLSPTAAGNEYEADTTVELTASPASGYEFDSWSGDLTGDTNPDTIVMDEDKSVTAQFTEEAAPAPPAGVGGTAYPPNKLMVLAPWIGFLGLLAGGITWLVLRRRRVYS